MKKPHSAGTVVLRLLHEQPFSEAEMTHTEAKQKLAEEVMGWKVMSAHQYSALNTPERNKLRNNAIVQASEPSIGLYLPDYRYLGDEWSPWTDTQQALDLAATWCRMESEKAGYPNGGYNHTRLCDGAHEVMLYRASGYVSHSKTTAPTLAAALTSAVCEAVLDEEVEVKVNDG